MSPALSEIQESTLTGGSHSDNKKEKQSGGTRIMAFENEVLSGNDAACMQCYFVSLVAVTCTWRCVISMKVLQISTPLVFQVKLSGTTQLSIVSVFKPCCTFCLQALLIWPKKRDIFWKVHRRACFTFEIFCSVLSIYRLNLLFYLFVL